MVGGLGKVSCNVYNLVVDMLYIWAKGRKLRYKNTQTNYEQAKISRKSLNQFRNLTEMTVADSKDK